MQLKSLIIIFILTLSLGGGFLLANGKSIKIESVESKTINLEAVYNQIKWIRTEDKDIWMMNQSHHGVDAIASKWDRVAIVVDKTTTPLTAKYYQFEPGPLEWDEDILKKQKPFTASCFICHSNGPRAIRPADSNHVKISMAEKLKLLAWNLRIKSYGRIHYDKSHEVPVKKGAPFMFTGASFNRELKVATCVGCHTEDGMFARGKLLFQHIGPIETLVGNSHMPPPGHSLSDVEKQELNDFLKGF